MQHIPRISESEWQVMRVLWNDGPATANEVVESLADATDWEIAVIAESLLHIMNQLERHSGEDAPDA